MTQAQRTQAMSTTTPDEESGKQQHKPAIKPVEVIGGALAAVTSAVIASFFGLGGTLVGVAVGSVASSVGAALYNSWLQRAGGRIAVTKTLVVSTVNGRRTSPDDPAALPPELADGLATTPPVEVATSATEPASESGAAPATGTRAAIRWKPVAILAALTFVLGLTTLTVAEALIGRPVSGGSGTTVGRLVDGPAATPTHTPERPTSSQAPGTSTADEPSTTTDATTQPTTTEPATTTSEATQRTSAPATVTTAGPGETSEPAVSPSEQLAPGTSAPSPSDG